MVREKRSVREKRRVRGKRARGKKMGEYDIDE
jgi:hypothetical protein